MNIREELIAHIAIKIAESEHESNWDTLEKIIGSVDRYVEKAETNMTESTSALVTALEKQIEMLEAEVKKLTQESINLRYKCNVLEGKLCA